jgi:hypothetical protein
MITMSDVIIEKKNEVHSKNFIVIHIFYMNFNHTLHLKLSLQNLCPSIEVDTGMERFVC